MRLDELNGDALKRCCGSTAWVNRMLQLSPFPDRESLLSAADSVWNSLTASDWLEALAQHPKIGEKSAAKWSTEEQRGMETASRDTERQIRELNIAYERKFGWIFIVCATGKTAEEMVAMLTARLNDDADTELRTAAAEQSKITKLRIEKLLAE